MEHAITDLYNSKYFVSYWPHIYISHFIPVESPNIGKYREKLVIYLVDDLACKDKSSGYVTTGIAHRALADDVFGPRLAKKLLETECSAVADMLSVQLRADLEKITGE